MLTPAQAEFTERLHCINCGSPRLKEVSRGRFTDQPLRDFIENDPSGREVMSHLQTAEWVFVECSDCEQRFHQRILNDEWNEKRFSEWMTKDSIRQFEEGFGADNFGFKFGVGRERVSHVLRIERLTRDIRKSNDPVRLLDFGCGWGAFVSTCKLFGFEAIGVDRSEGRDAGAATEIFPSIESIHGRQLFHAVTLFEVLEHLDYPSDVLRQLTKMIIPGGILVLETPDAAGVTAMNERWRDIHPLDHINAFTRKTLTSIASRHGFARISRGPAYVAASRLQVARSEVRHLLGPPRAQLYFRKRLNRIPD